MKRLALAPIALCVILAGGCNHSGLSGRYVDSKLPASYIEFHPDGTFFAHVIDQGYQVQYASDVSGTYRLEGNDVVVSTPTGAASKYQRQGDSLVNGNHTMVKR